MLSKEENELLTQVGPGTPGGALMRRYWHPIAPTVHLDENPVRSVRLLGEDLVLYRDRSGQIGLIGDRCIHRAVHMEWGIPEEDGLRCPYHGWLYNQSGQCTEMPLEPPDSAFKEKVSLKAYPVQDMGGLIWAYMGPQPAPLLPQWDLCVREDGFREIIGHQLPCNWLQPAENRADLGHAIYLHGRLFQYQLERQGRLDDDPDADYNQFMNGQNDRLRRGVYPRYRPLYTELGITKGHIDSDQSEDLPSWNIGGNPIIFPYQLKFGPYSSTTLRRRYQMGVPIDDTHTWHITYYCFTFPPEIGVPKQEVIPYTELPIRNENGEAILDYILAQDMIGWWAQGAVTDRTKEHLGVSDTIIIAQRKQLREQIQIVMETDGDPINVFRDPDKAYKPDIRLAGMEDNDTVTPQQRRPAPKPDAAPVFQARRVDTGSVSTYDQRHFREHPDAQLQTADIILDLYRRTDEWQRRKREQEAAGTRP